MLYDPKWEVEVKADPFTPESLVAWLETMPPERPYHYMNCQGHCLYGQYARAHGIAWEESGAVGKPKAAPQLFDFCCWVYAYVAIQHPRTFGAALDRARKALVA